MKGPKTAWDTYMSLQIDIDSNALMDMGATRSCMNYSTAYSLGKDQIKQFNTMQVVGADGSDLGAVGTISCKSGWGTLKWNKHLSYANT